MDTMSKEEWMERKNEIGRSYFTNSQTNCEIEESVPERSSPLWLDTSAASLSSRKTYTPLPDLLFGAQNPHDDTKSFYQRLEEKTSKYMQTSDTSSDNDIYAERSSRQSVTEKHNRDSSFERSGLSVSTIVKTTTKSKRSIRKSEDNGHRMELFESKKSKVDAGAQTEFNSYNEILLTSLESGASTKKKVKSDLEQEKFLVGDVKIFNICTCKAHKCE